MSELRRQLETGTVWTAKNDMSPLDGLRRAAEQADDATRKGWADELLQLLPEQDLTLRTRAVAALEVLPADPESVLNALRTWPDRFDAIAEGYPLFPPRLEEAIWLWLADKPAVREAVRDRLQVQPRLVTLLARHDTDWVLENAKTVVPRQVMGGVLRAFPKDKRADLVRALGPYDDAIQVLQAKWWKGLEDADALKYIVAIG